MRIPPEVLDMLAAQSAVLWTLPEGVEVRRCARYLLWTSRQGTS